LLCPAFALDREAFTFTRYDLQVTVEPEQQRLAVRGRVTLRNDSPAPQRIATLQISSSLDWRSIRADGKPLQFVSQPYTSDIDHTGALSEAIVTLPREVMSRESIELEIGYEGTIPLDTTRLTRLGTPADTARHSDWDQVSSSFTAVRGVGYVAWYPLALEAASLADGSSVFQALGRWKARQAESVMHIQLSAVPGGSGAPPTVRMNHPACQAIPVEDGRGATVAQVCSLPLALTVPAFVIANYAATGGPAARVFHLPGHEPQAESYAAAAARLLPFVAEWFGPPRDPAEVLDLADPAAAPFESGTFLLTPLTLGNSKLAEITLVHSLTHAAFASPRPWIYEGLAHFAQALYREKDSGRQAALDYLGLHRSAVLEAGKAAASSRNPATSADQSLISTTEEVFYRSKAACVWWMLRDLIGETALKAVLRNYHPEQDTQPSYVQRLVAAQSKRDLEWFFDDWVYRDRGLPEFRVVSAYPRPLLNGGYVTTVTIENLGQAGAEVPVTLRAAGGEVSQRLEVRPKSPATLRIETPTRPLEVVVNDGSVPETDTTNNTFKIEPAAK
jgi:hypothetical protein